MSLNKQNPGGQAGASRNQLGGWLLPSITASDRQAQMPVSVLRLIEHTFPDHRQAALAFLCGNHPLNRRSGQFLGQLAVDPSPLSDAQLSWLGKLLDRSGLPPLAKGGAQ